jgi:hypothetical protein
MEQAGAQPAPAAEEHAPLPAEPGHVMSREQWERLQQQVQHQ